MKATALTMTLMIGLPGSGKSTISKRIADTTGATVISLDAIRGEITGSEADQSQNQRVVAVAQERAAAALAGGRSIVVDATNLKSAWRQPWLNLAEQHGAVVAHERVETPLLVCAWRNVRRERRVPLTVIWRMWRMLRCDVGEDL